MTDTLSLYTQPYGRIIVNVPVKEAEDFINSNRGRIATDAEVAAAKAAPAIGPGIPAFKDYLEGALTPEQLAALRQGPQASKMTVEVVGPATQSLLK